MNLYSVIARFNFDAATDEEAEREALRMVTACEHIQVCRVIAGVFLKEVLDWHILDAPEGKLDRYLRCLHDPLKVELALAFLRGDMEKVRSIRLNPAIAFKTSYHDIDDMFKKLLQLEADREAA